MSEYPQAVISTDCGDIKVELWNDVAPKHVENFLTLARDGFYNDLIFHRIIPNFMVQGGCPQGTGMGGPGHMLEAEFNDREHHKGTLSMARSSDPNSAGSQFFLCLGRDHCQHLDGQYTAFGKIIEGMEVLDQLGAVDTDAGDRPLTPLGMKGIKPVEEG